MTELRLSLTFGYIDVMFGSAGNAFYLCFVVAAICTIAAPSMVSAQTTGSQLRNYNYTDEGLLIRFRDGVDETIVFRCQAYDQDGRPQGSSRDERVAVNGSEAVVPVSRAAAHYVQFRLKGRSYQVHANRGVQFPGDNATGIRYSEHAYDLEIDLAPDEVLLASGFRGYARTPVTSGPFEIGRTLGVAQGRGIAVEPEHAIVIAAKGTLEAVVITLTHRISETRSEYWEYPLVVEPELRRYVIPLSYFRPREPEQTAISSIYAVSFRTVSPARARDELTVDMLALTEDYAIVKDATRTRSGTIISINGKRPPPDARLILADDNGNSRTLAFNHRRSIRVPETEETRYFLCYGDNPLSQRCDPPDAPHTSYRLPRSRGSTVTIDLFEEGLPLNAYRELTTIFTSGMDSANAYKAERSDRRLELLFFPGPPSVEVDYAGYSTPLPKDLPADLLSVQLTVCKATASQTTMIGLRDIQNREPKVALGDYLNGPSSECQDASIPVEAFRAVLPLLPNKANKLARLKAITVTLEQGDERDTHQLILKRIAFTPDRTPLKAASFDRLYDDRVRWRTSFRRPVWNEANGSTHMVLSDAAGKVGRSLKVEIQDVRDTSYGLIALALGRIDVSPYQKLAFWIRGLQGGEDAAVYLNDGDKRERIQISDFTRVTTEWNRVEIPLDRFRRKVNLKKLKSILVAWEDQVISRQTVYLDDFVFE